MKNIIRKILHSKGLYRLAVPPGHYASPIPDKKEVLKDERLFDTQQSIKDIELNSENQVLLLKQLISIANKSIYLKNDIKLRYTFDNSMICPIDGLMLYSMINHFQPKRIIEVGSGFSSAIMLDINEIERDEKMQLTFIEPFPKRLYSLLRKEDYGSIKIHEKKIQNVDLSIFNDLEENDILFLDTSHIVKSGSDVNYWLFNILPILQKGVIIHIHDIFWPFEYSREWIENQTCYSEIYLIRAFLMNNKDYQIILFNNYLQHKYSNELNKINHSLINPGGSLWLKKL